MADFSVRHSLADLEEYEVETIDADIVVNANESNYPLPAVVQQDIAARMQDFSYNRYPPMKCETLCALLAEQLGIDTDKVRVGNGSSELLQMACYAFGGVGRKIAVPYPSFSMYGVYAQMSDSEVLHYPLTVDGYLDADAVLRFCRDEQPDLLILNNPNNPTGRLIADDLLEEILRICREKNIALFVDECFLSLSDGGVDLTPSLSDFPQLFILKAFTKSFGMAGLRLGYGLSADEALLRKMSAAVPPWNVSTLAQAAGVAALGDAELLERNRAIIRAERPWLEEKLRKFGFWVCPSQVNYILFRGDVGLTEQLRARGVAIRDCANFKGLTSGWYRVAVRQYEENEQLIAAIRSVGKE